MAIISFYESERDSMTQPRAWYARNDNCLPHFHAGIELSYVLEGELTAVVDGRTHSVHAGQLLANNCYSVHAYSSEECCSIVAIIPLGVVPSIQKLLTSNRFRRNVVDDEARTLETLMRMLVDADGNEILQKGLSYALLGLLTRRVPMDPVSSGDHADAICSILNYLNDSFTQRLTVEQVAAQLRLQPQPFFPSVQEHRGLQSAPVSESAALPQRLRADDDLRPAHRRSRRQRRLQQHPHVLFRLQGSLPHDAPGVHPEPAERAGIEEGRDMNDAQRILQAAHARNRADDLLYATYRLSASEPLDAFVLAPAWTPEMLFADAPVSVCTRLVHPTESSYLVEYAGLRLGWIQCGIGTASLVDAALLAAESPTKRWIFAGSAGSLRPDIELGEFATPSESLAYEGGSIYLSGSLQPKTFGRAVRPSNPEFVRAAIEAAAAMGVALTPRRTFCTESILCEYAMIDQILATGAEIIEMETAAFYECARMAERDAVALLNISDSSLSGAGLLGRTEEEKALHSRARQRIPALIEAVCRL